MPAVLMRLTCCFLFGWFLAEAMADSGWWVVADIIVMSIVFACWFCLLPISRRSAD